MRSFSAEPDREAELLVLGTQLTPFARHALTGWVGVLSKNTKGAPNLFLSLDCFSLHKQTGQIGHRYDKDARELERMDYLEFIAQIAFHIADKGTVMIPVRPQDKQIPSNALD